MINPEIEKEYGISGVAIITKMLDTFTDEEKSSVYAVGHHCTSGLPGMPHHIECDNPALTDAIWNKVLDFTLSLEDEESTMYCSSRTSKGGVKIWLTT